MISLYPNVGFQRIQQQKEARAFGSPDGHCALRDSGGLKKIPISPKKSLTTRTSSLILTAV
jgi:hypothetical protein